MSKQRPLFLLTTVESDSHMWNLVYLELLLEEYGIDVINLGSCVAPATTLEALRAMRPDALVISSVNGHGYWQGRELRQTALRELGDELPPFVIGGKLTTSEANNDSIVGDLRSEGFAEIFVGGDAIERFCNWLEEFKETFEPRHDRSSKPVWRPDAAARAASAPSTVIST